MLHTAELTRQDRKAVVSKYCMSPKQHYSRRVQDFDAQIARLDRVDARIGSIRLALGAAFLLTVWLCFSSRVLSAAWTFAPIAAFVAVLIYHGRVRESKTIAQRGALHHGQAIARLEDRWPGTGPTGTGYEPAHHLYAADLDLFGSGSLFQLLCAARTRIGESTLANWLLAPSALATVRERQAAVADLRQRLDLRDDLALQGAAPQIDLHPNALIEWAESPNVLDRRWTAFLGIALAAVGIGCTVLWVAADLAYPLLAILLVELGVTYRLRAPVETAVKAVEGAYADLNGIALILGRFESESFEAAPLQSLQQKLLSHQLRASMAISKLATVVNFVEARRNPLLAPLMILLMYPLLTAVMAERWRKAHGAAVRAWIDVLGEIEALVSLARYSYENPENTLPVFVDGNASFRATLLGHPLLPAATRISNDVAIAAPTRILLVSGSNMSGKSTLLRTVGINTVLAMAGAPVRALRLELTPLQLGASIRVNDSLHEGSSRFYAEITHLRQLFEPSSLPLLFLLDELLQGTNSADRRVGAQGVIRALLKKGAIGLVSTHDLALTDLAGLDEHALVNVHFQDEILAGKLVFDFKLHPGIVTKSNGIELMRSIGLDV
jgi:MutS domain V